MSKARLVITAVVVEGRSQSEVARTYGVSQGWISRLITRYTLEGEAAFEPRSRRPRTSPGRLPDSVIELIVNLRSELAGKGLDHGPQTIAWHLQHHHGITVALSTIHRHLHGAGLIDPTPQKRPKSSYIRFAAEQPNERWQADFTHWWLADGTHTEILCWINSTPNHPTTCGKVERFHQTLKKWLKAQPRATTIAELQIQLDDFLTEYNRRRPHRSLPHHSTPHTAYTSRPKADPANRTDTHNRVRRDRVDTTGALSLRLGGRLHHIGVGRTHAGTRVLMLIQDLNIRIINAATGELIRQLTLDPTRDYQPRGLPPGPTRKKL